MCECRYLQVRSAHSIFAEVVEERLPYPSRSAARKEVADEPGGNRKSPRKANGILEVGSIEMPIQCRDDSSEAPPRRSEDVVLNPVLEKNVAPATSHHLQLATRAALLTDSPAVVLATVPHDTQPPIPDQLLALSRSASPAGSIPSRCPRMPLLAMLVERRMLLLTPTNIAFGLATGLFPAKVTVLVKDALGAPEAAWMYSVSGATASILAALFALAARRHPRGRFAALVIGACGFGGSSGMLLLCRAGNAAADLSLTGSSLGHDACPQLRSRSALYLLFAGYGCGIAAWQGSCMALIAELWKRSPRVAFAHLKFTSGVAR